ncbi:hypothetical protein C8J56DRAFT_956953, partial [Mycena floridula]
LSKFIALALFAPGVLCASWLDINPALATTGSEIDTLNSAVATLPSTGATSAQALAIYSDLIKLRNAYDAASASVNSTLAALGPPSTIDASNGCQNFVVIGKSIASTVTILADKESAFSGASIGTTSLLKQGLTTLESSVKNLNALWLNITPEDYKENPITVSAEVNVAFDNLLAKF